MRSKYAVIAMAGLAAGGMAALFVTSGPQTSLSLPKTPATSGKALIGGPFSLLDHDGKQVSERDFAGRPLLVMFGFTHCPDICPSGLQLMAAALDKLGDQARNLTPVFITLDPERDTPAKLKEYVASFHPAIRGLTGSLAEITAAAKAYRVYFKKVPLEGGEGYTIDHSSFFYIMDRKGEFLAHVPHSANPDALSLRLKSAL